MEPRDLVGSARPKEAEIQGGRLGPNEDNQEAVGVSLLRRDDAINGAISEGEGVEEQGENLEEQEFSIKEASFKEGSLKLKIQTTKRTKKPPKNLENYICPPEIRMTIRPPMGEKSGRQSRTSGAGARASKDDEKGPPRKRTYERQFRMPEQREGSLLQLLGDPSPPKHQPRAAPLPHSQQTPQFNRHGLTQDWLTSSVPSTILNHPSQPEPPKTTLDQTQAFSRSAHSPSPQRSLTPDLQLPVVTDASILNLTSLSRGRGLQEVSEQLFGNIKKRYGRRESQKMPANPQCGETSWEKQPGKDSPAHSEERSKYRHEHIGEQYSEEREERTRMTEESKGRKRRWKPSFDESFPTDSSHLRQDGDSTEKHQSGPPDPKVAHKNDPQKNETHLTSNRDGSGDRTEKDRPDKSDKREKGERLDRNSHDPDLNRIKKNPVGRLVNSTDSLKPRDLTHLNLSKLSPSTTPNFPSPRPISSPRASMSPIPSPKPRSNSSPSPSHSISSTGSSKPGKGNDRWSYLKTMKHSSLLSPQRENKSSPSPFTDPPSPFPITPSSPLYTNTDSLTVHTPIKRKRGRPKKQPLLTVETIHEGTSTSPPSPLSKDAVLNRKRNLHTLDNLSSSKRGRGQRPMSRVKLGKMQSILNEILSGSSHGGLLSLKSSSAPVTTAMTAVASTIEARLGKQINVSKRGTIYIGKKRGRKPRAEMQESKPIKERNLFSGLHDSAVPSTISSPSLRADASMPSLQPISALHSKSLGRSFLSAGWKLSPPRLLANSPSHLSEGASVKEVTLSPISESHSEETIPSDSGIGTDNNSTSDQAEKGPASRRRYSFDLCGYETPEAAALDASSRDRRTHCELQVTSADNFLTQQEKKQKHHRRKRKCLQTRDHLHFLAELEEVVLKLQQLRVSHRRYTCYPQHPYPSIFRLNFHHFYPMTYDSYPCEPSPYMRRSVELKAKRRRGRPAKASEPITSKLPFVQGYGYPLAGGNYYAAPYAMPYAPPMGLGYFSPAPPFYLPHPSLGPGPSSPFMRPAVPPPKAYHSTGHSNLSNHQPGTKLHGAAGSMQGPSVRTESLGNSNAGGLRLHKRKHKHKHKHKDEPLLSPRNHQDLGGLFSGAKANARMNMISDRRDFSQGLSKPLEKQKNSAPSFGAFGDDSTQQPSHPLLYNQFHLCQTGQPIKSFLNSYSSDSQQPETAHDLFLGSQRECNGRNKKSRFNLFGDQGLTSFHATTQQQQSKCVRSSLTGAAGKRRYKRREVEQIQNNARRMHSLNFEHVQKILRAKRLQRQAKTGNNVIKRRPGRPRKQPLESVVANELEQGLDLLSESRADGRTLGMPVLERCDDLPGRPSVRPSLIPEALEFSNHDSIAATIETVVHQATSVPPAKVGKRRGRAHSRDDLWAPSSQ
ncbi:unnamed protein product [Knipowitschia caucasica]